MFAALGIEVTLIGGRDRLLPFLDVEIGDRLRRQMEQIGVRMRLGTVVEGYRPDTDRVELRLSTGERVVVDRVLVAAGRLGNTEALDLARIGLTTDSRGHVRVDEHYRTTVPHVYAAGDVIGFPALAAVAMEQARVAMCHAFDLGYKTRVSPLLPIAVYTIPEVAMAGETEETCREKGIPYCVGRAAYADNARGQIIGDVTGQVKLLFSPSDQKLLGVHVLGEIASELIHIGQVCLQLGGTLDLFIQAVFNYPTLGEAYKYAAYDGLGNLARMATAVPAASVRPAFRDERR
jgi:NAD(P) transhydrogenase